MENNNNSTLSDFELNPLLLTSNSNFTEFNSTNIESSEDFLSHQWFNKIAVRTTTTPVSLLPESTEFIDMSTSTTTTESYLPSFLTNNTTNEMNLTGICSSYCFQQCPQSALSTTTTETIISTIQNLLPNSSTPETITIPASTNNDMETWQIVLILIPLILISLTIILGNLLVIVAVFTQKSLRSPQNIYIVSLAIADMTVALIVLPFNITTILYNNYWQFGRFACKLYLILDVSLCTSSILHLCAIAVDRYRSITDGIHYMHKRNIKSVLSILLTLWIISFWIGTEPVLDFKHKSDSLFCELPDDFTHSIHLAIGALFFPLCIMAFLYFKIYEAIKERLQERSKVNCVELTSDYDTSERIEQNSVSHNGNSSTLSRKGTMAAGSGKRKVSAQISSFLTNKQKFSLSRERKAARTLGIIMGAFIVCWLPLGFLNIIGSLLPNEYKPPMEIFQVLTWLGYVNSGLNPIIYAASNQEFQKGFKRVLKLKIRRT